MYFPRALRRFLAGYFVLHLIAAALFVWVLTTVIRNRMIADTRERLSAVAMTLRQHVSELPAGLNDQSLVEHLRQLGADTECRFTLIANNGTVVVDSETGTTDIGPHGNRSEIRKARSDGIGFSERYSETLDVPMMYIAIPLQHTRSDNASASSDNQQPSGFVRVAVPASSINSAVGSLQRYAWSFALVVSLLTGFLMAMFSARAMQPLSQFATAARSIGTGRYDHVPRMHGRNDEWEQLSDAFQQMQTELKRRENRLAEYTERLEAALSSMIEGVLSLDPDGVVQMANGAARELLGTNSDLIGKRLVDHVRIPELSAAIDQTRRDRTFSRTEFHTRSDPRKTLSARVAILNDEPDSGVALVLHDVTELRQLETMRSDFVANVSHELKTPLAAIAAYAETLRMGAIHDQGKNLQFVEQIEIQAASLNRQIQDLLELARIESNRAVFHIEPVPVNKVCESCVAGLESVAAKQNVSLTLQAGPEPLHARADAESVQTIVNNLVTNAIHYTQAGGEISISTILNNSTVVIRVRDTGIGIAPEHQSRVFERFYRVDRARSRDKGGTGLGLSIVKHLAMAFGGSVHLESRIGKGSTFEVRLPKAT